MGYGSPCFTTKLVWADCSYGSTHNISFDSRWGSTGVIFGAAQADLFVIIVQNQWRRSTYIHHMSIHSDDLLDISSLVPLIVPYVSGSLHCNLTKILSLQKWCSCRSRSRNATQSRNLLEKLVEPLETYSHGEGSVMFYHLQVTAVVYIQSYKSNEPAPLGLGVFPTLRF